MTTRANLSELALRNSTLTLFFMLVLIAAGIYAYFNLGRAEDPPFTIKQMVVSAAWPGATAREMEQQVTDKLETKLQELPYFYNVQSYTKPGETVIYVSLRDDVPPAKVADLWYQVRKKVGDIRSNLPQGVVGPFFNDEYGDTYSLIWAFESDGFSDAEVKEMVKATRLRLLRVPDVTKADLFGVQDEKIYIEFSHARLAMMGVPIDQILEVVRRQNAIVAAGTVETRGERVAVRVDGAPTSPEQLAALPFTVDGRTLTLADVAEIKRGYADPRQVSMRFDGKPVIGLGVVMQPGGNVQQLGIALDAAMKDIEKDLPVGITVHRVSNQPAVVNESIHEFVKSLGEALAIVLVVSFISLGVRTGVIVALSVPLVLAITFVGMMLLGIDFQRISLGALIIALGLLVDDAIIAVEMMMVKLEEGFSRMEAATFAYTSTAFPMLTGTLVTAAGFVPVGFAKSSAGEYTNSIFWVVGLSLVISWFVAVLFTPWLGYRLLPQPKQAGHHAMYSGRLYRAFRRTVEWCLAWRKTTIAVTVLAFVASMAAFGLVQKQFFPTANRPELIVDLKLAQGASYAATDAEVRKLEKWLAGNEDVASFTSWIGAGSPRFYGNYNDTMMQTLSQSGNGIAAYVDTLKEARKLFREDFSGSLFPIADDVKIQVEFNPARVAEYRLIGYETRLLNREDFNNDQVDAGEVGAGTAVTALYEITPVGGPVASDPLRYKTEPKDGNKDGEIAFLKIRYKLPGKGDSKLVERPITDADRPETLAAAPEATRFALAVAAYGQRLRGDPWMNAGFGWNEILDLAQGARGEDPFGIRAEFVQLIRAAETAKSVNE